VITLRRGRKKLEFMIIVNGREMVEDYVNTTLAANVPEVIEELRRGRRIMLNARVVTIFNPRCPTALILKRDTM
jgi:hypothetical protein